MGPKKSHEKYKKYIWNYINIKIKYQIVWDEAKAVLRGKFIALNAHIRKEKKSKINSIIIHLRKLEKEGQIKSKISRRKIEQKAIKLKIRNQ